jgi:hypothetical protein
LTAEAPRLSECDGRKSAFGGVRLLAGLDSEDWGGGLGVERSLGESTRRNRLKIECLFDCGSGVPSSAIGRNCDARVSVD